MTGEDYEARKDEHRPDWPGYVSDHLPECGRYCDGKPPKCRGGDCTLCDEVDCICPALRACEQRVLLSKPNIELSAVYGYEAGRSDGLSAARDAIPHYPGCDSLDERWDEPCNCSIERSDALAAIDVLKEKP